VFPETAASLKQPNGLACLVGGGGGASYGAHTCFLRLSPHRGSLAVAERQKAGEQHNNWTRTRETQYVSAGEEAPTGPYRPVIGRHSVRNPGKERKELGGGGCSNCTVAAASKQASRKAGWSIRKAARAITLDARVCPPRRRQAGRVDRVGRRAGWLAGCGEMMN